MRCLLTAVVLTVALAGCGDVVAPGQNGRTPEEVLADAGRALTAATSYHVHSQTLNGLTQTTADFDIEGDAANGTISQNMGLPSAWTLHITVEGDTVYAAGESYWANAVGDDQAAQIGDRCVMVTDYSSDAQTVIDQFRRYTTTSGYVTAIQTADGQESVNGAATFQGHKAISISDSDSTVYVSSGTPSYPFHVQVGFGPDTGYTDFTNFNKLTAPIPAQQDCYDFAALADSATPAPPAVGAGTSYPTDAPAPLPSAGLDQDQGSP